jgi:hypothetical protein
MHKDCEEDNDRQRNANKPQKSAFTQAHDRLPLVAVKENTRIAELFRTLLSAMIRGRKRLSL